MSNSPLIRAAVVAGAAYLQSIYNVEVETSTATFDLVARTLEDQQGWITDRSGAHVAVVAEIDDEVVGFDPSRPTKNAPLTPRRSKTRSTCTGPITARASDAILTDLVTTAGMHGFHAVIARIVGDHAASIALHSAVGFEQVGREREVGRKFGRWLDVVIMERILT